MPTYRLSSRALLGAFAGLLAIASPSAATAFSPFLVTPDPAVAEATPAYRYANMSNEEAFAELDRRKILYSKVDSAPGVRAPVRLTARLHGVYIHSSLPPDQRVTSVFEILDARLLLALDDFAAVLEQHDIDELVHYTMYRPNVAPHGHGIADDTPRAPAAKPIGRARVGTAPPAKVAPPPAPAKAPGLGSKGALDAARKAPARGAGVKQRAGDGSAKPEAPVIAAPIGKKAAAQSPRAKAPALFTKRPAAPIAKRDAPGSGLHRTTWAPPGTRHPAGLAIDVASLHKRDGRWLSVARQFHGRIGDRTCGDGARAAESADAKELRALVCEPAERGIFTYVLTPNYNAAHADHYHMEIKPGVRWFLYH